MMSQTVPFAGWKRVHAHRMMTCTTWRHPTRRPWMPLSITIDSSSPVKDTVWDTVYSPLGVRKMMASVVDDGEPPVHASEQVATNSSPICSICSIPVPAAQLPEHLWEHQPIIFLTPRGEHTVSQTVSFTGEDESTLML